MISQHNGVNGRQTDARRSKDPFNGFFSLEKTSNFRKNDLLDARKNITAAYAIYQRAGACLLSIPRSFSFMSRFPAIPVL